MTLTVEDLRAINRMIQAAVPQQPLERLRGKVAAVYATTQQVDVYPDGSTTAMLGIPYGALPVAPIVGDDVVMLRSRLDGWSLVIQVLGRMPTAKQIDYPDSPGATATYLARIKRATASDYSAGIDMGIDAADAAYLKVAGVNVVAVAPGAARQILTSDGTVASYGYPAKAPQKHLPLAAAQDTACAVNGTWYLVDVTKWHETFTVDYIGQIMLFLATWSFRLVTLGAVATQQCCLHIRDDTSPPATMATADGPTDAIAAQLNAVGSIVTFQQVMSYLYTAASTGTKHVYAYIRTNGDTQSVRLQNSTYFTRWPWPASS